jgi:ABC-2 type transport system ATP-binding protein
MAVLIAEHVSKKYGNTLALQDVSLELNQGEILGLLGTNGSGKTTFIKILATLLAKDSGRVEIFGYDLDEERNEGKIRSLIGYVGQDTERSAYARLTVKENLRFFGRLRGLSKQEIDEGIEKLCAYFDFASNLDKEFMRLSGGQKQMVVIMRALLHDPPIIYLDEPTKGLDPIVAKKIRSFLKEYVTKEQKTLLLTSHNLSEVDELADRVSLMYRGSNPLLGASADLKKELGIKEFIEIRKESLSAPIEERIMGLKTVLTRVETDPEWVSFGVSAFFEGIEEIMRVLREEGIEVGFRHRSVTLEDVFINSVGILNEKFDL